MKHSIAQIKAKKAKDPDEEKVVNWLWEAVSHQLYLSHSKTHCHTIRPHI